MRVCIPQLVAGDLNLRNQVIDFVGQRFDVKTKTQQSVEIAGFLVSILVAGTGFEPATQVMMRRDSRLQRSRS